MDMPRCLDDSGRHHHSGCCSQSIKLLFTIIVNKKHFCVRLGVP